MRRTIEASVATSSQILPPEVRAQCRTLRKRLIKAGRDDIHSRFELGLLVMQVEEEKGKYTRGWMQEIEAETGVSVKTLHRLKDVAKKLSRGDLERLVARAEEAAVPLTWTHLVQLADVPRVARGRVLELTVTERLSAEELEFRRRAGTLPGMSPTGPRRINGCMPNRAAPALGIVSSESGRASRSDARSSVSGRDGAQKPPHVPPASMRRAPVEITHDDAAPSASEADVRRALNSLRSVLAMLHQARDLVRGRALSAEAAAKIIGGLEEILAEVAAVRAMVAPAAGPPLVEVIARHRGSEDATLSGERDLVHPGKQVA